MFNFIQVLFKYIKSISEYASVITKFSIGLGLVFILGYFAKIGYFPKDLSLGDGFVFLLITLKFILIYSFFIGTHYFFGKTIYSCYIGIIKFKYKKNLFNLLDSVKKIHLYRFRKIDKNKAIDRFIIIVIIIIKIIFFPLSILILWGFYQFLSVKQIFWVIINLIFIVMLIDAFNTNLKRLRKENVVVRNVNQLSDEPKTDEKQIVMMFLVIIFLPAFIYFNALDNDKNFLMKLTFNSLRVDTARSSVFLKKEYKDLLPESKFETKMGNYYKLKDINIPLRGIGKNALITYPSIDKKYLIKVEIPNDAIQVAEKEKLTKAP